MKHAALLAGFIAVFVLLAWGSIYPGPYIYDEADYMFAASQGPLTNAFDTHTLSMPEFIRLGLGLGKDRNQQSTLSEAVRNNNDVVFYRHWHGPLLYYFLAAFGSAAGNEQLVRASILIFPILTLLAVYFGSLWVLPPAQRQIGAILASALVFWNFAAIKSSEVAPHQAYATAFVCTLMLLAKTIATGERKYWYLSVAAAALAFATLEVAFVLVITLLISAYVERRSLEPDWPFGLKSAAVFVGTVLLVWPAAILKLSFLKAYFFLAYLSLFRKSPWGQISLLDTWRTRILDHPLDWALFFLCLVVYVKRPKLETRGLVYPFLIYGGLMVLTVLRVATYSPRYILPFLQAFDIFAAFVLASLLSRCQPKARVAAVAVLCAAIGVTTWLEMRAHPLYPEPRPPQLLASIREQALDAKSLLVPQLDLPVIHYYFPNTRLRGYRDEEPTALEVSEPNLDAILYPGYPVNLKRLR